MTQTIGDYRDIKVACLDHGYVRLVDYMGGDLSIVCAARCSHDADWRAGMDKGSDNALMNYLWSHYHTTPFEAVEFQFEVQLPIFVVRQWHRHRTQSYNEVSARYTQLPDLWYEPQIEHIGMQSTSNKQGRDTSALINLEIRQNELELYSEHCQDAFALYKRYLNSGWPKELARCVLPLATYTRMFAKMNLLNLFRFISLRSDSHAQYEIRVYSDIMLEFARHVAPTAVEAFGRWEHKLVDRFAQGVEGK